MRRRRRAMKRRLVWNGPWTTPQMGDPKREELETLWRSRVLEAQLRWKGLQRDAPDVPGPGWTNLTNQCERV